MLTNDMEALRMIDNVLDLIYYDRENLQDYTWKDHAIQGDEIIKEIAKLVGHDDAPMFLVNAVREKVANNKSLTSIEMQAEAWEAVYNLLNKNGMYQAQLKHDHSGLGLALAFIQHILDRMNTAERIIENHDLCHDKHGQVGVKEFAEGCADEQRKHYGRAPDAEDAKKWRALCQMTKRAGDLVFYDDGSIGAYPPGCSSGPWTDIDDLMSELS